MVRSTHCKQGHKRTPETTTNKGDCRICARIRSAEWYKNNLKKDSPHKTHCVRGHERTPENVNKSGGCKICSRENARKRYDPKKAAEKGKKYRQNNPEKVKESSERYRKSNADKVKAARKLWIDRNRDKVYAQNRKSHARCKESRSAYSVRYAKENMDKILSNVSKRKAAKANRTPSWLTDEQILEIRSFYTSSKQMTKETGIEHHVDHIVPLRGKLVSGLHVPWNLQVIPAEENRKKHNCFAPGAV